jgi:RNA polymerase sigma factor (sigma-70 family)
VHAQTDSPPRGRARPVSSLPSTSAAARRLQGDETGILSPSDEQVRWFNQEVYAHEPALRSYLRGSFPAVQDVDDVVQESYLRIWRARLARPITSTKSFLFQIARHLIIDGVRRSLTARTISLGDLSELPVLEDRPDAAEALTHGEKVNFVAEALASLPARCREIMILRKFEKWSHAEIAARLGISERTVDSQLTRGMKLMEARLRARGEEGFRR